jgi:hypothetical protein
VFSIRHRHYGFLAKSPKVGVLPKMNHLSSTQSTISEWARSAEKEILAIPMPSSGRKKVWFGQNSTRTVKSYLSPMPKSRFSNAKQWYTGDASMGRKRFCGGKIHLCAFVCVHICTLTLFLLAILIPVTYFVIIPNNIQAGLSNGSADASNVVLSIGTNGNNFHADLDFKKFLFLPGTITLLGPTNLNFGEESSVSSPFANIIIGEVSAPINQNSRLGVDGNFTLSAPFFIISGIDFIVYMKTEWTIKMWGIVWYRNLPLTAQYNLQSDAGKVLFKYINDNFLKDNNSTDNIIGLPLNSTEVLNSTDM